MRKLLMASFCVCLSSVPVSLSAQGRPIEGHQNLKLGMTIAEASAAEPLAEPVAQPDSACPPGTCLAYFDRRFLGNGYRVRAEFGPDDSLHRIALSMLIARGESPCRRQLQNTAKDFTRAYGAPQNVANGVTTWQDGEAAIALTDRCTAAAGSTIAIVIDSRHH